MSGQRNRGKTAPLICNIIGIVILLAVLAVCLPLTLPRLFGYEIYNVESGSMEPVIPIGSAVFVHDADPTAIEEGDIIAFLRDDTRIVHRVVENRLVEGQFVTKGDANALQDMENVSYDAFLGLVEYHFPILGNMLTLLTGTIGRVYVIIFAACGVMFNILAALIRANRKNRTRIADLAYKEFMESELANADADLSKRRKRSVGAKIRTALMIILGCVFVFAAGSVALIMLQYRKNNEVYREAANRFVRVSSYIKTQADSGQDLLSDADAQTDFSQDILSDVNDDKSANGTNAMTDTGWDVSESGGSTEANSSQDSESSEIYGRQSDDATGIYYSDPNYLYYVEGLDDGPYARLTAIEGTWEGAAESIRYGLPAPDLSESELTYYEVHPQGTRAVMIPRTHIPEYAPIEVDFDGLLDVNTDVIGWIYCDGTVINYPVLQSDNNNTYLRHTYDGAYNIAGSVFVEGNNRRDFRDANSIIYGHHMQDGSMFAGLDKWADQEYYEGHPVIWLLTPQQDYKIVLWAGYTTSAYSDTYLIFENADPDFPAYLADALAKSDFAAVPEAESIIDEYLTITEAADMHFVLLSTCAYVFDNARYVLHGVLVPVDSAGGVPK